MREGTIENESESKRRVKRETEGKVGRQGKTESERCSNISRFHFS